MSIGLIVSDIQNPFFGALASNIETLLRQHGYSTILCNTNEVPENEKFYLQVLMDRKVDGIIIAPTHTESWDHLESIKKETSIVLIDRVIHHSDLPWVTGDNMTAAESLTNRLIEEGYRKIGYLGGIPGTYIESVRFAGFRKAFQNQSLKFDKDLVVAKGYSSSDGEAMMENMLKKHPDIEAVLCVNNLVFFGAIGAVQRFEAETKRSIMMAAFDIGPYCHMFKRPLLCGNQDLKVLADSAVSLLMDQIEKKRTRQNKSPFQSKWINSADSVSERMRLKDAA